MHTALDYAVRYRDFGLHPIPIEPRGKNPLIEWKKYQTEKPTDEDLDKWWPTGSSRNIGLVLGRGVFAVDLDGGKEAERLLNERGIILPEDAPRVRTGSGQHVFLRTDQPIPDCVALLSTNGQKPQVDIRGIGYVVAPPSIHPSGSQYEWLIPLDDGFPAAP